MSSLLTYEELQKAYDELQLKYDKLIKKTAICIFQEKKERPDFYLIDISTKELQKEYWKLMGENSKNDVDLTFYENLNNKEYDHYMTLKELRRRFYD